MGLYANIWKHAFEIKPSKTENKKNISYVIYIYSLYIFKMKSMQYGH